MMQWRISASGINISRSDAGLNGIYKCFIHTREQYQPTTDISEYIFILTMSDKNATTPRVYLYRHGGPSPLLSSIQDFIMTCVK